MGQKQLTVSQSGAIVLLLCRLCWVPYRRSRSKDFGFHIQRIKDLSNLYNCYGASLDEVLAHWKKENTKLSKIINKSIHERKTLIKVQTCSSPIPWLLCIQPCIEVGLTKGNRVRPILFVCVKRKMIKWWSRETQKKFSC